MRLGQKIELLDRRTMIDLDHGRTVEFDFQTRVTAIPRVPNLHTTFILAEIVNP